MRWVMVLVIGGCARMMVETVSVPATLTLALSDTCGDAITVEHYVRDGYATDPRRDHIASVDVPQMRGGSNEHDPGAYKVIRLRVGDRVLHELSLDDIHAFPHDPEGRALVPVNCQGAGSTM